MTNNDPVRIAVDTREQKPLTFDHLVTSKGEPRVTTSVETLRAFDYGLMIYRNGKWNLDPYFAVEHKSKEDFFSSFTTKSGIAAEAKKIAKARTMFYHAAPIVYVVDCNWTNLLAKNMYERRKINPEYAMSLISKSLFKLNACFLWCSNREESAKMIYKILKHRREDIEDGKNYV